MCHTSTEESQHNLCKTIVRVDARQSPMDVKEDPNWWYYDIENHQVPYQGRDPIEQFLGKYQENVVAQNKK